MFPFASRIRAAQPVRRSGLSSVLALALLVLAAAGPSSLPAQFDLTWTNAAGDNNLLNQLNYNSQFGPGVIPPFSQNLIFNGEVSNADARFIPQQGQNEFFANSLQLINGYSGEVLIRSTPKTRVIDDENPDQSVQEDAATFAVQGSVTVASGTLTVENSAFTPQIPQGLIKVDSLLSVNGAITLSGGRLRIRHVTFSDDYDIDSDARIFVQGSFNWSGGILQFDATQGKARKKASLSVGGDWNQSIGSLIAVPPIINTGLLGGVGRVTLSAQPSAPGQAINVNGGGAGTAVFPSLIIGTKPITMASNDNIYCAGKIDDTSLIVGSQLILTNASGTTTAVAEGALAVGPFQDSELRIGNNRRVETRRNIAHGGGLINVTGANARLKADGGYSADAAVFQGPASNPTAANPTAALNVTGSNSQFLVRSFSVNDPGPVVQYTANFGASARFENIGGEGGSKFEVLGVADVNLPYNLYLGGPSSSGAKEWIATTEVNDLGLISNYPSTGPLRLQNPLDITVDYLYNAFWGRIEVTNGRKITVTNGEISNLGFITLTNGDLLRPTNALFFSNADGAQKNVFIIDEDYIYAIVRDSDKNLNGTTRDRLPYVKWEVFSGGLLQEVEEFDFGIAGSYRNTRFRETGNYNWTFRNYYGIPLYFRTAEAPSVSNDGVVRAIGGDGIRMTYIDPNGSGGQTTVDVTVSGDGGGDVDGIDLLVVEGSFAVSSDADDSTWELQVKNQGKLASGAFNVGFYEQGTQPPTIFDAPTFQSSQASLAAGATRTVTVARPPLAEGFYDAWVLVDNGGAVTETNEDNNAAGPLAIGSGPEFAPDLVISAFNATAKGRGVQFDIEVTNQGTAASASCQLNVLFDSDGPPDATPTVPGLVAGGVWSTRLFSKNTPIGSFQASALVDSTFVVTESVEDNNFAQSNAYDTSDASADGKRMTFSSLRANAVPITLDTMDVTGETDGTTDFERTFAEADTSVVATAPEEFAGRQFLHWYDGATEQVISLANDATIPIVAGRNIRAVYSDIAPPSPDLVVESFTAVSAGGNIDFTVRVKNHGNAGSAACTLAIYYNRAGTASPPSGDVQIAVSALAAGQSATRTHTLSAAPSGTYTPVAFIDSANVVAESAETNNTSKLTSGNGSLEGGGGGGSQPDLLIDSLQAFPLGRGVLYVVAVRNGGAAASGACQLGVSFDSAGGNDVLLALGPLASGATTTLYPVWVDAPLGNFQSTVTVDATSVVTESNEGNNVAQTAFFSVSGTAGGNSMIVSAERADNVPITIQQIDMTGRYGGDTQFRRIYDPAVTSVEMVAPATASGRAFVRWYDPATNTVFSTTTTAIVPVVPGRVVRAEYAAGAPALPDLVINRFTAQIVGRAIQFSIDVKNAGDAASGACTLALFYQRTGVASPPAGDQTAAVGALAAGQTTTINFTLNDAPAGAYEPVAFVDSTAVVTESAETNNWSYRTDGGSSLSVTLPDLTIDTFVAIPYGSGVTFEVLVRNVGDDVAAPCTLGVSFEGGPGSNASVAVPSLPVGGFRLLRLYRIDAPDGTYTALATVDTGGVVAESNEGNNSKSSNQHATLATETGNRLTIMSARVDGVGITVDRADLRGRTDGTTQFSRLYGDDVETVRLTAPALVGSQAFERWYDPVAKVALTTSTVVDVAVEPGRMVRAEYAGAQPPAPDLTIDSFEAVMTGDDVTYSVVVTNLGNAAAGASTLAIYRNPLDGPASPPAGDQTAAVGGLAVGQSLLVQVVQKNAQPGRYAPVAFIDSVNVVAESAETNNTSTLTGGNFQLEVIPFGARRILFSSVNASDVPVRVGLADLSGQSDGVTQFSRLFGRQQDALIEIEAPATWEGRSFVRWYDSAKDEDYGANPRTNVTVRDGRVLRAEYAGLTGGGQERPDLVVDWLRAEMLGAGVIFWARVSNVGNATAGASRLAFWWDHPGFPTSGAGANATTAVPALLAGESAVVMTVWVDAPAGLYTPWVFVDDQFAVAESSEDNNANGLDSESVVVGGNGDSNGTGSGTGSGGIGGGGNPGDGGGQGGGLDVKDGSGDRNVTFQAVLANDVPVTIDVYDSTGRRDGVTTFQREYNSRTTTAAISVPAVHAGNNFVRWFNATDGLAISGDPATTVALKDGLVLIAEYDGAGLDIGGGSGNGPDLIVENLVVTTNGVDARLSITFRNAGTQDATATTAAIYYDLAASPTGATAVSQTIFVPALAAGFVEVVDVDLINQSPRGPYRPWVWVDRDGNVTELSEDNNILGGAGFRFYIFDPVSGIMAY